MGAFFGCLVLAMTIFTCIAYGVEPGLIKIANELQRIADTFEGKKTDDNSNDNPSDDVAA